MTRTRTFLWLAAALVLAALGALLAGVVVRQSVSARFLAQAQDDARLRQALLASEIARFRLLPLALGDDRDLAALVAGAPDGAARMNAKLERLAGDIGASVIYVIRKDGLTLAASNWRNPDSFLGKDYSFRPYFRRAAQLGEAEQFALGTVSRKPGLFLARRAAGGSVVVVKLEFDRIEAQWRAAGGVTFVTDRDGVILVSSRPEWRFSATRALTPAQDRLAREVSGVGAIGPRPYAVRGEGSIAVPGESGGFYLATTPPDAAGWRVNLAQPGRGAVDGAVRTAQLASALAVLLLAGLAAFIAERGRRRRLRTAELEAAVAARTAELRREIEERAAAEEHAAELREGLRQANRLATLGQVTASVAHETAQPVAAIRNYAATSRLLLDRGSGDEVRANLAAIDRLAARIGTVTAELRGFARKGSGENGPVPLAEIVDGACLLLKERLSHVAFERPEMPPGLTVIGGRVRLEQVLVNLLQNALEALQNGTEGALNDTKDMDKAAQPRLSLIVETQPDTVRILVADNGPGIAPEVADRLFTPFATSRPTGLGLGLVIARDIVEDFGGTLHLLPTKSGACFAVTLRRAP